MIEVRIRHESESKAVRLCDWPATRLDELIPTIERWGIFLSNRDLSMVSCSGQFVTNGTSSYFEVICFEEAEG